MRQTHIAGIAAAALVAMSVFALPATAQETPEGQGTEGTENNQQLSPEAIEALRDGSASLQVLSDEGSSSNDGEGSSLEALDPDPENDPLYIDPEENPFKKVSSSEMFLEWTDGMEEGEGKEFVQAWARNSSVPDTANPIELWKQEAQGSAMMSSGLFTGDFAQSSAGSSQATSVLIPVILGFIVVGQLIELIMRGIRMATN